MFMPILRNMAHAHDGALADGGVGDVLAEHLHLACAQRFKTRNPVNKLRLTVAVYARNADDFTGTNIEADVFDRKMFMQLGFNADTFGGKDNFFRFCLIFVNHKVHIAPDHHAGEFLFCCILNIDGADASALSQHCTPVRNRHDFVQLV